MSVAFSSGEDVHVGVRTGYVGAKSPPGAPHCAYNCLLAIFPWLVSWKLKCSIS